MGLVSSLEAIPSTYSTYSTLNAVISSSAFHLTLSSE